MTTPVLHHSAFTGRMAFLPPNQQCQSTEGLAYGPADATASPSSLAPVKSRMVYLSGAGLPRLSWEKGR